LNNKEVAALHKTAYTFSLASAQQWFAMDVDTASYPRHRWRNGVSTATTRDIEL